MASFIGQLGAPRIDRHVMHNVADDAFNSWAGGYQPSAPAPVPQPSFVQPPQLSPAAQLYAQPAAPAPQQFAGGSVAVMPQNASPYVPAAFNTRYQGPQYQGFNPLAVPGVMPGVTPTQNPWDYLNMDSQNILRMGGDAQDAQMEAKAPIVESPAVQPVLLAGGEGVPAAEAYAVKPVETTMPPAAENKTVFQRAAEVADYASERLMDGFEWAINLGVTSASAQTPPPSGAAGDMEAGQTPAADAVSVRTPNEILDADLPALLEANPDLTVDSPEAQELIQRHVSASMFGDEIAAVGSAGANLTALAGAKSQLEVLRDQAKLRVDEARKEYTRVMQTPALGKEAEEIRASAVRALDAANADLKAAERAVDDVQTPYQDALANKASSDAALAAAREKEPDRLKSQNEISRLKVEVALANFKADPASQRPSVPVDIDRGAPAAEAVRVAAAADEARAVEDKVHDLAFEKFRASETAANSVEAAAWKEADAALSEQANLREAARIRALPEEGRPADMSEEVKALVSKSKTEFDSAVRANGLRLADGASGGRVLNRQSSFNKAFAALSDDGRAVLAGGEGPLTLDAVYNALAAEKLAPLERAMGGGLLGRDNLNATRINLVTNFSKGDFNVDPVLDEFRLNKGVNTLLSNLAQRGVSQVGDRFQFSKFMTEAEAKDLVATTAAAGFEDTALQLKLDYDTVANSHWNKIDGQSVASKVEGQRLSVEGRYVARSQWSDELKQGFNKVVDSGLLSYQQEVAAASRAYYAEPAANSAEALDDYNLAIQVAENKFNRSVDDYVSLNRKAETSNSLLWRNFADRSREFRTENLLAVGGFALALFAPVERAYYRREDEKDKEKWWEKEKAWEREKAQMQQDYWMERQGALEAGDDDDGGGGSVAGFAPARF